MPNDSTTGGYIQPTELDPVGNDQALRRFLQQIVVGITGLPGNVVLQRWLPEDTNMPDGPPPNNPGAGVNWAAIGVKERTPDTFVYEGHMGAVGETPGYDIVYRNEILDTLCSFYGPACEQNSELFFMGLGVAQNREAMQLSGFGFVEAKPGIAVPAQIKNQWLFGIDVSFKVRRGLQWKYPVRDLAGAVATINYDTGLPSTAITVSNV